MADVVRHMIRRIWDHLCHVTGTTTNQKQSKTTIFLQKEEETQLSFLKNIESDVLIRKANNASQNWSIS